MYGDFVVVAVGDETADTLIESLTPKVKSLKIGAYNEPDVEMGPVVSKESQEKIVSYIDAGINAGADLKVDGRSETERDGFFVGGCLFDHVTLTCQSTLMKSLAQFSLWLEYQLMMKR